MRTQPSTIISGPVSATVTDHDATGRGIAAVLTVEVSASVPASRRYGLALDLVGRFLEHHDIRTYVHHVQSMVCTGSVTYTFN